MLKVCVTGTEEDTAVESDADILHTILTLEHFSLGICHTFGLSFRLIHAVADDYTGATADSCADCSTDGGTLPSLLRDNPPTSRGLHRLHRRANRPYLYCSNRRRM